MSYLTQPAFNKVTQSNRIVEQDSLDQHFANQWIDVDEANITGTNYYPSASGVLVDGKKDLSLEGELDDPDGDLTLTVEVSNEATPATSDFKTVMGRDDIAGFDKLSWSVSNDALEFAASFNNINYKWYRVKVVASGATNNAIINARGKAL